MPDTTKRILIIDDDHRNIFALKAVLSTRGYDCRVAGSAPEGIALLRKEAGIQVVLMDMMMPEMDGYEAIGVLKTDPQLKDMPVVAVTAQAMLGDREKCLEAGADAYISKPIDVDALVRILNDYVN